MHLWLSARSLFCDVYFFPRRRREPNFLVRLLNFDWTLLRHQIDEPRTQYMRTEEDSCTRSTHAGSEMTDLTREKNQRKS